MKRDVSIWNIEGVDGLTPLQDAAIHGHLDRVPQVVINSKAMLHANKHGNTALHYAAIHGHLDQVSAPIMLGISQTAAHVRVLKRALGIATMLGFNDVIDGNTIAKTKGALHAIPNFLGNLIIKSNMLLPNNEGITPLHLAAKGGNLKQVPEILLTETNMGVADNYGGTVIQSAFAGKGCYQLPTAIMTQANILHKDTDGDTSLHLAAEHGTLDAVPAAFMTEENLITPNKDGLTPLHQAAYFCNLAQVPKEFLTVENLLTIENGGETPIHKLAKNVNKDNSQLDMVLGLDFPNSVRTIVGESWWNDNEAAKLNLPKSKATVVETAKEEHEVEIF